MDKTPVPTTKDSRFTWAQLSEKLLQDGFLELQENERLFIYHIDSNDFISAVEEENPTKRLGVLVEIMKKYGVELSFEGSLNLGPFNLADHSWVLNPGATGHVRILAKPATVRKPISEVVSFLSKLPSGQALVLRPFQELFLEELTPKDMMDYYQLCQEEQDNTAREKEQDLLFSRNCKQLSDKNLTLKIYGLNAKQIDRSLDTHVGGLLFKPVGDSPRLVLALVAAQP